LRIGIDLGGTKIAALLIDCAGRAVAQRRIATPREDYEATVDAICHVSAELEREADASGVPIGIGMPGSLSPRTGRVQNANSTWLNRRPFAEDLTRRLGPRVRLANDANCFALSEAIDGAGAEAGRVLGVILGTGCGSGFVSNKRIMDGPRGIGGEWGHNPLPWPTADEWPGPPCWCGRHGCMETWVSGPALSADHARITGDKLTADGIARRAEAGDAAARATLVRHADRLARGLATVVNILDPDVIVLGGGLSGLAHLYDDLPHLMAPHIFADETRVDIRPPRWGDASGVRGAAWLWPATQES
jgi:fructokinase